MSRNQKKEDRKEPKIWGKLNVEPELVKPLKQIALDENIYVYQLIDDMARKLYPEYFRGSKGCPA